MGRQGCGGIIIRIEGIAANDRVRTEEGRLAWSFRIVTWVITGGHRSAREQPSSADCSRPAPFAMCPTRGAAQVAQFPYRGPARRHPRHGRGSNRRGQRRPPLRRPPSTLGSIHVAGGFRLRAGRHDGQGGPARSTRREPRELLPVLPRRAQADVGRPRAAVSSMSPPDRLWSGAPVPIWPPTPRARRRSRRCRSAGSGGRRQERPGQCGWRPRSSTPRQTGGTCPTTRS